MEWKKAPKYTLIQTMIFNKDAKTTQQEKDKLFNKCWENWQPHAKKMKLDLTYTEYKN
jgi:hypothetical protein